MMPAPRKIRLLFIIDCLNGIAGTEKHLYDLMKNLDKNEYAFDVIAFSGTPRFVDRLRTEGFSIKVLDIHRAYGFGSLCKYVELIRHIRKVNYDIVQTFHFFSDTVGVILAVLGGTRNVVSSRRDMGFRKTRYGLVVNNMTNRFVARFIAVSNAVEAQIAKVEHIEHRRIVTIYNGIDTRGLDHLYADGLRKRLGIGESDIVIGIVGHLRPEKNHELLFRAIQIVSGKLRNVKCLVVGACFGVNPYPRMCEQLGIAEHVIFTGLVDDPMTYISIFDIACLTSKTEGMSNALIEKMAMGKAVIATKVGGNVELVRDRFNGLLVSPDNPAELAEAILHLASHEGTRVEMGRRNREIVARDFSIDRMIRKHDALYRSLVAAQPFSEGMPEGI